MAAIITPASPQYVVGAADNGDDVEFDGPHRRPSSASRPPLSGTHSSPWNPTCVV